MPAIHAMTAITCSALIHSYIVDGPHWLQTRRFIIGNTGTLQ
jgi:hypothetical protein